MENQQLTGADKTPEQIQAEMNQTRESLTDKVAALENQVVGTVQTAADTLTGTVASVKSLITDGTLRGQRHRQASRRRRWASP